MAATQHDTLAPIKTAGGVRERGSANQRHLVREIEQIEGVFVFCSFTHMGVEAAVQDTAAFGPLLEACERYGFELAVERTTKIGSAAVRLTADGQEGM